MKAAGKKTAGSLCLAVLLLLGSGVAALAQDKEKVIAERQEAMKGQGRDLVAVRNYAQGKTDQGAALAAVEAAKKSVERLPPLFPPGTGIGQVQAKTRAKPEIWQQHDKFVADYKTVLGQLDQLAAAVKSGDKAKVEAAYTEIGACKACHNDFRAKGN
ncbi:MAG: c-type cytochrome [Thiohalocapsa sp.]